MKAPFQPWHLLVLILAGWINRRQQDAIDYLLTENRILREKLGKKRILLTDDQRRRLAVKGKILGRKMLEQLATISGYDPSLASGTRCTALGLQPTPEERWTAASVARDRRAGASHCQRKSNLGLRANSGRAL